ncbi:radical SAM protein [Tistrella bauzanensis]|uniref:Radical SAM protein n=1 Tax=Tistrella arctica TaxID=3133430 RepID=A0ABU9YDU8_9PROT
MTDAVLVFPPSYYPWFVAPGLSHLTAWLKAKGWVVAQRDANIPAIEHVLRPEALAAAGAPDHILAGIGPALATMRDEAAHHALEPYLAAKRLIEEASTIIDAAVPDTFLIFRNTLKYISAYDARRREAVMAAVADRENHLFHDYYRDIEVPAIAALKPRLVGLSVNDHHQLIPSMVLASMLREALPDTHITIGGNLIARLKTTLEADDPLTAAFYTVVDSFIHHEGEQPLAALLEELVHGRVANRPVPQVIRFDGARPVSGPPSVPVQLDQLPRPDPEAYRPWTPEPVTALNIYRGCYYSGICSFCDINEGYDTVVHERQADGQVKVKFRKRLRPMAQVAEDLAVWHGETGRRTFSFTDEWFRVSEMLELGEHLAARGLSDIHWEAYARFERAYLDADTCVQVREAGGRFLQFGLESIAPATIKAMKKGNTPDDYARSLANTTAAGIWNHVFFIVGYPGEPIHHVLPLFRFLTDRGRDVLTVKPTRFQLARRAPLIHSPPEGIEVMPEADWDLFINIPFQYTQSWWCRRCRTELDASAMVMKQGRPKCAACNSWAERWAPLSRKAVDGIYTLSEVLCERHWSHPATSLFPYVARLFLSEDEMTGFADRLPRLSTVDAPAIDQALVKVRGALAREAEMIDGIGRVYADGGLTLPKKFEDYDDFLDHCMAWTEAAAA